jgi:hypothetical protein
MCQTPPTSTITGITDTGASGHYIRPHNPHNTDSTTKLPTIVGLPNGMCLQSTTTNCTLALPQLPEAALDAHILPGLTHSSLISIGKLCNAGCTAIFNAQTVTINKNNTTLLHGNCEFRTGLWQFPLTNPTTPHEATPKSTPQCNSAYHTTNIPALIKFLHSTAFSPVESTWLKAINKGFFQSWPGIIIIAVHTYFPSPQQPPKDTWTKREKIHAPHNLVRNSH